MSHMSRVLLISALFFNSALWAESDDKSEATAPIVMSEPTVTTDATLKKDLPESQIPLKAAVVKKDVSQGSSSFGAIMGGVIVSIMAAAGFIFLKKYSFKNIKNPHTEIKILTQHHLGPKKSLAIIRVAGESVLIGITDQNINLIKSLSLLDEDIPEETPSQFNSVISAKMTAHRSTEAIEEVSFNGIKDRVTSTLKNMRSFE